MHVYRSRFSVVTLAAVLIAGLGWYAVNVYREFRFIRNLHLVSFSTSMIRMPRAETERDSQEMADRLQIDLARAYEQNIGTGARFHLAWMLISRESAAYYAYAKRNVDKVPWAEVRIWAVRYREDTLSPAYREKLIDLLVASPTSEAKLTVARWHRQNGRIAESEDAWYAAMTGESFWDSLDAADALIDSERYSDAAVRQLFAAVRDTDFFLSRAANSIVKLYAAEDELGVLVGSCESESQDGPNRKLLVERLAELIDREPRPAKSEAASVP